jgi:hypothetical protein
MQSIEQVGEQMGITYGVVDTGSLPCTRVGDGNVSRGRMISSCNPQQRLAQCASRLRHRLSAPIGGLTERLEPTSSGGLASLSPPALAAETRRWAASLGRTDPAQAIVSRFEFLNERLGPVAPPRVLVSHGR